MNMCSLGSLKQSIGRTLPINSRRDRDRDRGQCVFDGQSRRARAMMTRRFGWIAASLTLLLLAETVAVEEGEWPLAGQLLPHPQRMRKAAGSKRWLADNTLICIQADEDRRVVEAATRMGSRIPGAELVSGRDANGQECSTGEEQGANSGRPVLMVALVEDGLESRAYGAYNMSIGGDGVKIQARDARGLFYGMATLSQMLLLQAQDDMDAAAAREEGVGKGNGKDKMAWPTLLGSGEFPEGTSLPAMEIADWPGLANRGIMLDISRNRVHSVDSLKHVADILSYLKLSQLQLYTEHTFAYPGHEAVWGGTGALTPSEVLEVSEYCHDRFISLVPNQQSLGHMQNWLKHEAYMPLAEDPRGSDQLYAGDFCCCSWQDEQYMPYSISTSGTASLDFLASLYQQLLPSFPHSSSLNVGLDEAFDIKPMPGMRHRDGVRASFLQHLRGVHGIVAGRHNRTLQFWGDMVSSDVQALRELPGDVVVMEWGYESGSPFAEKAAMYSELGVRYYVCPGTSSWNTLLGRTDNALLNIFNAGAAAKRHGAEGMLVTDWGDNGHMQPLPVSYLGFLAAADFSWNVEEAGAAISSAPAALKRFSDAISRLLLSDSKAVIGRLLVDAGRIFKRVGPVPISNRSPLFNLVVLPNAQSTFPLVEFGFEATKEGLESSLSSIDRMLAELPLSEMGSPQADLVKKELGWALRLSRAACEIGIICAGKSGMMRRCDYSALRGAGPIGKKLEGLAEELGGLWGERAKEGSGLADSQARLRHTAALLLMGGGGEPSAGKDREL